MKTFLTAVLLFTTFCLYAQPKDIIEDKALLLNYLKQSKFDIDTNAHAIVLYEKGSFYYMGNKQTLKIERTIKILNTNAQREGDVVISGTNATIISDIKGTTYNIENDQITQNSIQRRDKLSEEISDNLSVVKFSLPNVKAGSIIHYSYTKEFPSSIFLPDWNFQEEYPKLCSVYESAVHPNVQYTVVERTTTPFEKVRKKKDLRDQEAACYQESTTEQSYCIWLKRNIAGYKEEPFMLAADNYLEMLRMNVTSISRNGYKDPVFKDWNQLNDEIFYRDDFGGQVFNGNTFLEEKVNELISTHEDPLDKAKHIFKYVRDNINYINSSAKEYRNIKSIYKSKKGNHQGINFLLTAMLSKAGLEAEPVLLASRNNECLSMLYTNVSNIDYFVSKLSIEGRDYYLDASEPYIGFNQLPAYCYNGMARTINKVPKSVYLTADSVLDRNVTMVNVSYTPEGNLKLKLEYVLGNVTGYKFRMSCKGDSTVAYEAIEQSLRAHLGSFAIATKSVSNVANPDLPLKITMEGELPLEHSNLIYLNPYFDKFFNQNPFIAEQRSFPVTMDNRESHTYICTIKLPENYKIDDYPKSSAVKYEGTSSIDFKNNFAYNEEQNIFKIQSQLTTNATSFLVEEYPDLRKFYNYIIDEQNKNIVIKKIK